MVPALCCALSHPRATSSLAARFGLSYAVSSAVRAGKLSSLPGATSGLLPSASALAFLDNHDSQRTDPSGVLTYKDGEAYAIAAAFLLAWPYGRPRLMSSYYFDDADAGPPATPVHDGGGAGQPAACGDGPTARRARAPTTASRPSPLHSPPPSDAGSAPPRLRCAEAHTS